MKYKRLILYGCAAGLLIGAALGAAWAGKPYTSTAVLRLVPAIIPDRYVSAANIAMQRIPPGIFQDVFARRYLLSLIENLGLYPAERRRMPLEDVVEIMRPAIKIGPQEGDTIQVSFSYSEPLRAQKVNADFVSRVLTDYNGHRRAQALHTLNFLKDRARKAADDWENSLAVLRAAQHARLPVERAQLDADIARQRYENLSLKVAEADMVKSLEDREEGPGLEVLDPASLPSESRPSIAFTALIGAVLGALAGWLTSLVLSLRPRPAVAEAV